MHSRTRSFRFLTAAAVLLCAALCAGSPAVLWASGPDASAAVTFSESAPLSSEENESETSSSDEPLEESVSGTEGVQNNTLGSLSSSNAQFSYDTPTSETSPVPSTPSGSIAQGQKGEVSTQTESVADAAGNANSESMAAPKQEVDSAGISLSTEAQPQASASTSAVFTSPSGKKSAKIVVACNDKEVAKIRIGQTVEISPLLTGYTEGATEFNYVWEYEGWKSWWSTIKETGRRTSETSYVFTPSKAGTYTLYLDVVSGGKTQTVSIRLIVEESWSYNSLTVSKSTVNLGESVTVTPQVSGLDASFARFNYVWAYGTDWSEWSSTVKQTGAQTKETSWTFTPARAGTYHLYVDAVDSRGKTVTKGLTLRVVSNWSINSLSVTAENKNGATVQLGKPVNMSFVLNEGSNLTGLTYNFGWRFGDGWSEWTSIMKNGPASSTNQFSFTPTKTGKYILFADVIGTDGTKRTVQTYINVVLPYSFKGVSAAPSSITIGSSVTVKPSVSGDIAGVKYNYVWCYNGGWDLWSSTVKETGSDTSSNSWTFTPTKSGTYVLYVDVVAPGGAVRQTLSTRITVNSGWNYSGVSLDKKSPQYKGTAITVKPSVSGSRVGELQYNYVWLRNNNWNDWSSTVKETGKRTTNTSWTFTPTRSGTYTLFVDAYDTKTGQVTTKQTTIVINSRWKLKGLNLSYSSPMRPWSKVTMTPVIEGDTTGLKFNYVWEGDGWYVWDSDLKHGSYATATSKTISIGDGGVYSFYVDVVDQYGEKQTAQVTGIRARYAADIINRIANTMAAGNPLDGTMYENTLLGDGGSLCNGRRGWWCANFIWWAFRQNGVLDLWGTGNHLQVDPEYLANEYRSIGRFTNGTSGLQRGDILFFYWVPWRGGQWISHAAYVSSVTASTVTVLEGNMGYRSVYHTYSRWDSHIRGYARPAY